MTTSIARNSHTTSLLDGEIVDLPQFPFTPADPLIVTRRNPLD
ncbi:hypothetical protein MARA_10740 [Mycolicibacterium arabiense]|uniref:Uncharacterized protein n=1 Tax=Mycolicibacterium arabiense TaxID=1286181 RepID=A0A7I7RUB2_9MYCO|nr:hypothetical protein [Mycolicibacterium arabiense]BBY47606.1 hypothetical protein MARA_10740 [Mycolicibacterium arabiense]